MTEERIENDHFFAVAAADRRGVALHRVPPDEFFVAPAPPREASPVVRLARTPLRFGLTAFLVGWAGILFQASLLQQVVFGAPVFEELAKLGPALLLAWALRLRPMWLRVPLGWLSGAGFAVFEHVSTYASEDPASYVIRLLFHAGSTGLSMAFWTAFEAATDVRARWATTAVPTVLHWANNFVAVALGFGALALPALEAAAGVWSVSVGALCVAISIVALVSPWWFGEAARAAAQRAIPRLGL